MIATGVCSSCETIDTNVLCISSRRVFSASISAVARACCSDAGRLAGEDVEHVQVAVGEADRVGLAEDVDHAQQLVALLHRQRQHVVAARPVAEAARQVQHADLLAELAEHVQDGPVEARVQTGQRPGRQAVAGARHQALVLEQGDHAGRALQDLDRRDDDQLQHGRRVGDASRRFRRCAS